MKYRSRKRIIWGAFGILGILGVFSALVGLENKAYLVTEVIDGDTIKVKNKDEIINIRYIGIDTPELSNECYAEKAKQINEELVLGKEIRLEFDINEMDRFGRYLAYVYIDDIFVNQYLLEHGAGEFFLDTVNLKYQDKLIEAGEKAYKEKKGLWSDCAPDSKGCVIKGNYDIRGHRWYHLPYFRHYKQVVVNLDKGDRWFCTEENAIKAGFERARE